MSEQTNCVGCDESPGSIAMSASVLVSKMFQEITGLKVKSHYTLCKACQQELRSCYNFRKRCLEIFTLYESSDVPPAPTPELAIFKSEHESTIVTFTEDPPDHDTLHDENFDDDDNDNDYQSEEDASQSAFDEIHMPESEADEDEKPENTLSDPDYEAKFEKFRCSECPKAFTHRPQLVAHQAVHRQHTVFSCPRDGCHSNFTVTHRLVRHLRNVHDADEDEIEEMRDTFKAQQPKRERPARKPPVPEGKVQCEVCLKVLANKRYLKEHMELQHLKTAKYSCTHGKCRKRFKIWSLYEMHMKKHNGQFDFVCRFCGKGYVQRKIFNSHLRNSHQVSQDEIDRLRWSVNGAEPKDNKCDECKVEFKTPHKLFEHKALVHGEGKRYICDICGKAFFSKAFLSSHQKYHKGVKNKRCTKCPSAFTEDKGLRTHLRRVHHMSDEEVYALGITKSE